MTNGEAAWEATRFIGFLAGILTIAILYTGLLFFFVSYFGSTLGLSFWAITIVISTWVFAFWKLKQ